LRRSFGLDRASRPPLAERSRRSTRLPPAAPCREDGQQQRADAEDAPSSGIDSQPIRNGDEVRTENNEGNSDGCKEKGGGRG
jgi:hypothetical protein